MKRFQKASTPPHCSKAYPETCASLLYIFKGRVHVKRPTGDEVLRTGDVYYLEPGHVPVFEEDTEVLEFSSKAEYQKHAAPDASAVRRSGSSDRLMEDLRVSLVSRWKVRRTMTTKSRSTRLMPPDKARQTDKGNLSWLLHSQEPRQLVFAAELGRQAPVSGSSQ